MAWDVNRFKNELLLQRRLLLIGIAVVGGTLLSLIFAAWPLWGKIQTARDELIREQNKLAQIKQRAALVTGITEQDAENFALVGGALPLEKEPLQFLQALQQIGGKSGVSLSQYDLNPGIISTEAAVTATRRRSAAQRGTSRTMNIAVEFTGRFSDLLALVDNIEKARPIMEIESITVDPARRTQAGDTLTSNLQYTARLTIRTYYQPVDMSVLSKSTATALTKEQQKTLETLQAFSPWFANALDQESPQTLQPGVFQNTNLFGTLGPSPVPTRPSPSPEAILPIQSEE